MYMTKVDSLALPLVHLAKTRYTFGPPQLELDHPQKDLEMLPKRLSMTLQVNFLVITHPEMTALSLTAQLFHLKDRARQ